MNKQFHQMLEANGYRNWQNEDTELGEVRHYQKRIDTVFPEAPLCTTNDKLHINIEYHIFEVPDRQGTGQFPTRTHEGVEVCLRHGAGDDLWFDLKAYGLKPDALLEEGALDKVIARLVKAWIAVYSPE